MKFVALVVGTVLVLVVGFGLWFNRVVTRPSHAAEKTYQLVITKGLGVTAVGEKLKGAGYISTVWHWKFYIAMSGLRASILPGTYALTENMSIQDIAKVVSTAEDKPGEVKITFPEGWTAKDIADVLDRANVIDEAEFLRAAALTDSRTVVPKAYGFLADKPVTANLEGYLFPDTYQFFVDSTATQVLEKFLDNFDAKFTASMREQAKTQNRTVHEVITLASILEKELRTDQDRKLAADLFLRRINIGMPLQSDATVNYVTGKSDLQPTLDDTAVDSLYNTYKNLGLPPGPIANPGLSAIRAALNPEPNEYFYFLTELNKVQTHFSKTLEEHNRYKDLYLK